MVGQRDGKLTDSFFLYREGYFFARGPHPEVLGAVFFGYKGLAEPFVNGYSPRLHKLVVPIAF